MTALGVLCCFALFVCLTLLASSFLLSSLIKTCTCTYDHIILELHVYKRVVYIYIHVPDLYTSGYKNLQLWSEYYTTVVTRMYRMYSGGHNNVQWWSEYYMAVVIYPEHVY